MRGVPEADEPQDPSAALVTRSRAGDADAWDALVSRYAPVVWAVARGHGLPAATAGDVSHTTFLRLAESLPDVDGAQVGSWLVGGARREALHAARWLEPRMDVRPRTAPETPDAPLPVAEAVEQLPARARLALRLVAVAGDGAPEVAAGLDVSQSAAADLVAQGLTRLSELTGAASDLRAQLQAAVADAPPPAVLAAARAAYTWRTPDGQLTPTSYDNLLDEGLAAVRGDGGALLLGFAGPGAELDLEVSVAGSQRRVVGRLSVPGSVRVTCADGSEPDVTVEDVGFRTTVPQGPLRLECRAPDGAVLLLTTWVLV